MYNMHFATFLQQKKFDSISKCYGIFIQMLQKVLQSATVIRYENKLISIENSVFFSIISNKILQLYKINIIIHINPKICLNTNFKSYDQVYSGYKTYLDFIRQTSLPQHFTILLKNQYIDLNFIKLIFTINSTIYIFAIIFQIRYPIIQKSFGNYLNLKIQIWLKTGSL